MVWPDVGVCERTVVRVGWGSMLGDIGRDEAMSWRDSERAVKALVGPREGGRGTLEALVDRDRLAASGEGIPGRVGRGLLDADEADR